MIKLKSVLTLSQPFISAASGLLKLDRKYFVIADDENYLGIFDEESGAGEISQVFSQTLPMEPKLRKKEKADFESIAFLPEQNEILIIPSGSTSGRMKGVLLNRSGKLIREISFKKLFESLLPTFPELNIEGSGVKDDELWLWQRGNGSLCQNAVIRLKLSDFLKDRINILAVHHCELGKLNNVPLSFTDGAITEQGIYFLAVAEMTTSTYLDGQIEGSCLGLMSLEGQVLAMEELELKSKPEGLCLDLQSETFSVVTDDDDRMVPAVLYEGKLPSAWKSLLVL